MTSDTQAGTAVILVKWGVRATVALFILTLFVWMWPLRSVPTGSRGVITVGGAIRGIEAEGFTLVAPWQRLDVFNIRAEQADIKRADGPTIDLQSVATSLTVRYAVVPERVAEVFEKYTHDGNLNSYVETAAQEVFKAVTVRFTAPEMISKRATVSAEIRDALAKKLDQYGAKVINIDMTNFAFSAEYTAAINQKTTQEQLRQAADNKLKTVESEQKQKVAIAEAEANAIRARADGDAYANVKIAKAQAEALDVQGQAIARNKDVLELRRIEVQFAQAGRWNGVLPINVYGSAPIPFMNLTK